MRIAIIGSGIAGLTCAHVLRQAHEVTLFEADGRPGGHAHTHEVSLGGDVVHADTGFLVYNEATYPTFIRLLDELGVETEPSDMSFSVSDASTGLVWRGSSFSTTFAQPRNLVNPAFLRMLLDIVRFNRLGRRLLADPPDDTVSLGDVLATGRWSRSFYRWYLIPLGASIWSADPTSFSAMPAVTFARFFERHGLFNVSQPPRWRTITHGSRSYVDKLLAPLRAEDRLRLGTPVRSVHREPDEVVLCAGDDVERFDHVVVACHSDEALSILADPSPPETEILGAIGYQANRATLHTDASLLPPVRRAWASWNYQHVDGDSTRATVTYLLNSLQGFDDAEPLMVTLNQDDRIDPGTIIDSMDYRHPVFDAKAIVAQQRRDEISGVRRTSYCGAYWGYGFHEDGARSAVEACEALGVRW